MVTDGTRTSFVQFGLSVNFGLSEQWYNRGPLRLSPPMKRQNGTLNFLFDPKLITLADIR